MPGLAARRAAAVLLAFAAGCTGVACGDEEAENPAGRTATPAPTALDDVRLPTRTEATLVLDFVPNAVHAGIYRAVAAGYYDDVNIDLKIVPPTSTADTVKLIDAGKADIGLADAIDVAGQVDAGRPAQAIMAVVQRPLGGVVSLRDGGIRTPKDLEGRRVGVTGVPSDTAVLDTMVADAGGDPDKVETITVGFNGVQNLEGGAIDAFVGYWPADGTQVDIDGKRSAVLKFDEHGGPQYPGLVAFSSTRRIADDAPLLAAFVGATVRGYDDTIADPTAALDDLLAENPALKRATAAAQLRAYTPLFRADAAAFGELDPARLQPLSAFLVRRGLIDAPISPERLATSTLLPDR